MAIYFGNNKVAPKDIKAVYFGNNSVYSKSSYPPFAEATWAQVKEACQAGVCSTIWSVGDIKTMIGADGTTYTVRIVDMTPNRYAYTDGSRSSNAVFEIVELVKNGDTTTWKMNPSCSAIGGWSAMPLKTETLPTLQSVILPIDLQALLAEVDILSLTLPAAGSMAVGLSANKLFLPALYEISTGSLQGYLNEVPKGIWQYYSGKGMSNRIKYKVGTSTAEIYQLRSSYYDVNYAFNCIGKNGASSYSTANYAIGIAPCFVF